MLVVLDDEFDVMNIIKLGLQAVLKYMDLQIQC